jgi:hypothetical protein
VPGLAAFFDVRDSCRSISLVNLCTKILNKMLANQNQLTLKRLFAMIEWDSSEAYKNGSVHANW